MKLRPRKRRRRNRNWRKRKLTKKPKSEGKKHERGNRIGHEGVEGGKEENAEGW